MLTLALLAAPAGLSSVGAANETVEPDCRTVDDGAAVECQLPAECEELDEDFCDPPADCERLAEDLFRCPIPDEETIEGTTDSDTEDHGGPDRGELIQPETVPDQMTGPVVECGVTENETGLVCRLHERCEDEDAHPACQPPSYCERVEDRVYRCHPQPPTGPPSAREDPHSEEAAASAESDGVDCRPGPERGTVVCEPPAECEGQIGETEYCTPPPECEARDDGTFLCTPPDDAMTEEAPADADASGPTCRPGPERGTVICEPPAECEGQIGETEYCTPPPECESRGDGTFLCQIPDRATDGHGEDLEREAAEEESRQIEGPETDDRLGGEDSLFASDEETRAEARQAIAAAVKDAAASFREDLGDLKAEYEERIDELRQEYRDGKDKLRADYEDCRASVNETGDRTSQIRECLQEARQGLDNLKQRLKTRHQEIKSTFEDRIEQARSDACEEAEAAAMDAVAKHGLFDANPAELLPDRALELCPSFADFDGEGER